MGAARIVARNLSRDKCRSLAWDRKWGQQWNALNRAELAHAEWWRQQWEKAWRMIGERRLRDATRPARAS